MKQLHNIMAPLILFCLMMVSGLPGFAQEQGEATSQVQDVITPKEEQENTVDVKEIVFGHIGDSYEWHITTWGKTHITIPLPIIVYSNSTGWHVFLSSRLEENGGTYEGLSIAPEGSKYEGKLVEYNAAGEQVRPWDISITKVTFALLFNSVLLLVIVLSVAHWYRKRPQGAKAPGGFIGFMEMFIMMVNDDIIKSCVGPNYRKFAPYLLTAFFFIFINNMMGLIPFFPGGANVTGNIAITMVLAVCTFLAVNIFGTKHYWKDIFATNLHTKRVPEGMQIEIRKPPIVVNSDNFRYLQILDAIRELDMAPVDTAKPIDVVRATVEEFTLKTEMLILMARKYYGQKTLLRTIDILLEGSYEIARG